LVEVKKIIANHWAVSIPDNWEHEDEADMLTFYNPDSSGTMVISTVIEDEPISDDYMEELLEEHLEAGAELQQEQFGPFMGVSCCFSDDEHYWCEWYLFNDNILLFVTYDCELDQEGEEDDVIESILESLSLTKLH
jgi:hypothetical protein